MNRKFLYIILFAAVICGGFVYAQTSQKSTGEDFVSAFQNCTPFESTDTVEVDGMSSKVNKKIIGWDGYTCKYQEIIEFKELNFKSKVNCEFSGEQVRDIYTVMNREAENAKKNPAKYQNMSLDQAQNSPVLKVWNKYLGDSSVCKIEM